MPVICGREFTVHEISRDGACAFAAVCRGLGPDSVGALELRHSVVKYICDHWNELGGFTDRGSGHPYPSCDAYSKLSLLVIGSLGVSVYLVNNCVFYVLKGRVWYYPGCMAVRWS